MSWPKERNDENSILGHLKAANTSENYIVNILEEIKNVDFSRKFQGVVMFVKKVEIQKENKKQIILENSKIRGKIKDTTGRISKNQECLKESPQKCYFRRLNKK